MRCTLSPGSERRLARVSRTSRGALSHIGTRGESPSGSGRRHAWNSRPTGRYRNLGSLPHMPSSVEDGCGLRNTQCNTVMFVYGVVPSRPSGCLTEKIGFPGRARSKPVCVVLVFCVVWLIYVLSGSYLYFSQSAAGTVRSPECNLKINQFRTALQTSPPAVSGRRAAHTRSSGNVASFASQSLTP